MGSDRLIIVSNRLPVTAQLEHGAIRLARAEGGLATGMRPWHERGDGVWVGWPGDVARFSAAQRTELDARLAQQRIVPVYLSKEQIDRYYHRFSNGVLWPLLHYQVDRVPVDTVGWAAYRQVNARFADQVARAWRPGDLIWVHDYQLMLLPSLLRERLPSARIGFFLHIPFPSSEVFRVLPWRREILQGLLGADLIGFHTFAYLRHFVGSLLHVDGVEADVDSVRVGDRDVGLGVFPMGVDAEAFSTMARDPDVAAAAAAMRADAGSRRVLLGVDRLDYTKGIPRRLVALERLLTRQPSLRKCGVIERIAALVEPALVGQPVTVIVDVWLEKEDVRSVNDFKRLMRDTPEVIHCYHVTGDHTFVMIVALPSMEAFAGFAERVFDSNRAVAKFRSSVVMNRVKTCGPLPVSHS